MNKNIFENPVHWTPLNLLKCTDKITENRKIQEKLIKIKHNQEEEKQEENQQNHSPFT